MAYTPEPAGTAAPPDRLIQAARASIYERYVEAETSLIGKASFAAYPIVQGFFDKRMSSIQYVVADPETKRCAIIDPVLDFDLKSGATATLSADELLATSSARATRSNGSSICVRTPITSRPPDT